jgi:hypothetical protein
MCLYVYVLYILLITVIYAIYQLSKETNMSA